MQSARPKIIVVCGPTASGKSNVAIRLAKKFNGEVISADSRQIYKGMDLGTGKVSRDESNPIFNEQFPMIKHNEGYFSEDIRHHLIDIVEPMEDFNVSHFKKTATEAIENILSRDKLPIICGGTGFWISTLVNNINLPDVEPDEMLRSTLRNKPTEELFAILSKLDPDRAATIEKQNPVRLIRAIEIATALGKVPDLQLTTHNSRQKYTFLQVGIDISREILNEKIKKRLDERFENGMVKEVENLHEKGVSWEWMEKIGLEYRWISRYLQNMIPLEEMKEKLYFDIIHYAKRQMTWLKKNREIIWLSNYEDIEKTVAEFIGN